MSNNHILTKNIGNLRGFSTDNIFVRPSNVADIAINLQRNPDTSLSIRRGYQCQIADIGGLGTGTFHNTATDGSYTVTINDDGLLYNKLEKQIYFYYDGQVTGTIIGASQSNPCIIHSVGHGLITGTQVLIRDVNGMVELNVPNSNFSFYTITFVDADHFSLNGVDSTAFTPYTSGGTWSIYFADNRYLTFTIFTDPRFLASNPGWSVAPWSFSPWGAPSGESITCQITVNRAAQVNGLQTLTNTLTVQFGHELATGDVIQFVSSIGIQQQRLVTGTTTTSVTFDGYPVTVSDKTYINQFFDIPFRRGFDVTSPYLISTFISTITDPIQGIFGLQVAINGDSNYPAAFLQILEPVIIDNNNVLTLDYWYWQKVNKTVPITFPGSVSTQNDDDFENASFADFDDVIYIANGVDYPQKYDGQNVYRAGMPEGDRPTVARTGAGNIPDGNYIYAITYEQVDQLGHIVEGVISEGITGTATGGGSTFTVTVNNILANSGWNTDCALAVGGLATVYGPDINGNYYDLISVSPGHSMNIGDIAFYNNTVAATKNGASASAENTFLVFSGHGISVGDIVTFTDSAGNINVRNVTKTSSTTITVDGTPVQVNNNATFSANKQSLVFGNIAIVNGNQTNVNIINVSANQTIQLNDIVSFVDVDGRTQRRTVTAVGATTVTISGIPVSVNDKILITSETIRTNQFSIQTFNTTGVTLGAGAPISNNLRINIYRTVVGGTLYQLLTTIPNNSLGAATQTFVDNIKDDQLGRDFADPIRLPNPPPISKYVLTYRNQLLYAGGKRGDPTNDDNVFFSEGDAPESVPAATNFFTVPSTNDEITGIGIAGTTLIVFKNNSCNGIVGDILTSQFEIVPIAPGENIGCVAFSTIASVGSLLYFLSENGVYALSELQIFPTDKSGNAVPLSIMIDRIFRENNFLPQTRYVFKRAVGVHYKKDKQYLLFLPCEDSQRTQKVANANSVLLCFDYEAKNWFQWYNMNCMGGLFVIDDDLYFHERRFSGVVGNTANLYKQHRFYRLVDHADHASEQKVEWRSSWEDLGVPEVRKKFSHCMLLIDRISNLLQFNNPQMYFSSYLDRIPNLQSTKAVVTTVNNTRNAAWSQSPWGYNFWSGYQDSFVRINMKGGTVAKSMQVGFTITGINIDIRFAGVQLEAIPEFRRTFVR